MKKLNGLAYAYWETGTEGVLWSVVENFENEGWSRDDLHILKNGDHLILRDRETGEVVFDGVVNLSRDLCKVTGPNGVEGQGLDGFWVHGVQADGCTPEEWSRWFHSEKFLAEVERK